MPFRRWALLAVVLLAVLAVVWAFGPKHPASVSEQPAPPSVPGPETVTPLGPAQANAIREEPTPGQESVGKRPTPGPGEDRPASGAPQDFGRSQPVQANASPQAASVAAALKDKNHPERFSVMFAPKSFDKTAFEANPEAYLKTVEPGRVFQTAQPGPGVPVLVAEGERQFSLKHGEVAKLKVKSAPLAPVSFTSFDMGEFAESKLNCVTVRADEKGIATATFVAKPGAVNDVRIMAASPLAIEQVRFLVTINEVAVVREP